MNGLPFYMNKCEEKCVSVKIAAKTSMFECLQRLVTFSQINQKANHNSENLVRLSLGRFSRNLKGSNFCPKAIKS